MADHTNVDWLLRSRLGSHLFLIAGSAAVPAAALHALTRGGEAPVSGVGHLVIMAVGSSIAAFACIALAIAGVRGRDGRSLISGGAFGAMTLLLVIHGLATPGVFVGPNGMVRSPAARPARRRRDARPLGAPRAAAPGQSGRARGRLRARRGSRGRRHGRVADPSIVPGCPKRAASLSRLFVVGAVSFASRPARRTHLLLTRRTSDLLVGRRRGCRGQYGLPSYVAAAWWLAHALEVAGIGLVGIPAALDLRSGGASRPWSATCPRRTSSPHEEAFLGRRVRALMLRLAAKDRSTEDHTRRVAELAVQIGDELGLPPGACASWRSAVSCTTWASSRSRTPSSTSPARWTTRSSRSSAAIPATATSCSRARLLRPLSGGWCEVTTNASTAAGTPTRCVGRARPRDPHPRRRRRLRRPHLPPRLPRRLAGRARAVAAREEAGVAFDPRCVDALERLVGVAGPELRLAA